MITQITNLIKKLNLNLQAGLEGIREAVLLAAELLDIRVHQIRLQQDLERIDRRWDAAREGFGRKVYALCDRLDRAGLGNLQMDVRRLGELEGEREQLLNRIAAASAKGVNLLSPDAAALFRANGVEAVMRTLDRGSPHIGKPSAFPIVAIFRRGQYLSPPSCPTLRKGDQVLLVGTEAEVREWIRSPATEGHEAQLLP